MSNDLKIALVSMPWMSPSIPSIQLATLKNALLSHGIKSDCYEFFLDYAAYIGLDLYNRICAEDFLNEFIFAKAYNADNINVGLDEFLALRRSNGFGATEFERQTLKAVELVTPAFVDQLVEEVSWQSYDAIGFSLTISQCASSMALAKALKARYPAIPIIFGGSSCAGPMGAAMLRASSDVDVVVSVEGELVLPELLRALADERGLERIPGISWRRDGGVVINDGIHPIVRDFERKGALDYEGYFERKRKLGLDERTETWLPFESSRGCWYGQKRQCTFCGLHEVMKFRQRSWVDVLAELEQMEQQYGCNRFFAVDLIMPHQYYSTLLPEIHRRGHAWTVFYEIKANVRRSQLKCLSDAGVRWIQPGIESLDFGILALMRKGVSAVQNVQLLKWCKELSIRVTWNVITGIPGEDPESYPAMAQLIRNLCHLAPPSGASRFSLHRFSPYFEEPAAHGLASLGADPLYRHIFPIAQHDLDDLVYHHKYSVRRTSPPDVYTKPVLDAIQDWKVAAHRNAQLAVGEVYDGYASILDTRWSATPTVHTLTEPEHALFCFMDEAVLERNLKRNFEERFPALAAAIDRETGFENLLASWESLGLIARIDRKWIALATRVPVDGIGKAPKDMFAPIPYLDNGDNAVPEDVWARRESEANDAVKEGEPG